MLENNTNFIKVNTKQNLYYIVEQDVLETEIKNTLSKIKFLVLLKPIQIKINEAKSNLSIFINCKFSQESDWHFTHDTKMLIFEIEQKVFSLINTKPTNINLVFGE
ncbi:hypothetical protein MSATCC14277_2500 [Metamycoplasma salivarium]|uniref:MMB_0454 family protein n=1 Tax=Metamycoplasma salivarium TaxID=2124 RepID=UPI001F485B60|nr:hypothetical protein [Metamycoplasma salivarium]GIZ05668.1 hypothetical protein MSATCC14277_2500 [Metamycoplasma salivarium]GIZ06228.1 hypothetical protein MSATCC23557_2000 [Metamycoplasma salivarium]GIZ06862.1 hypothetical protein MSATCC33130_2160 [Metamycoplasma salivarium]